MIEALKIENFKVFESLELDFAPLTVLTGSNSTGKSTVIQALLLAQQAMESESERIGLNGPYGLALGEAKDVQNWFTEMQLISFELRGSRGNELIVLSIPLDRAVDLEVARRSSTYKRDERRDGHVDSYLSAERLGPRDLLEINSGSDIQISVGHQGQFTAHALTQSGRTAVNETLQHPTTNELSLAVTLEAQAQVWLSSIVSPVQIEAKWPDGMSAATLRFREPKLEADWSRPANVGFGLSYALPVLVAALMADVGSLLLIENPEAHLHPAGQSLMGQFLVRAAAAGIQVVVETHSDHIINGIRLAIAQKGLLPAGSSLVHFFGGSGIHHEIKIEDSGSLTKWPKGFFDQSENDLAHLSRIRRRG